MSPKIIHNIVALPWGVVNLGFAAVCTKRRPLHADLLGLFWFGGMRTARYGLLGTKRTIDLLLFERSEFLIDTSQKKIRPCVSVCVRLILVLVWKTLILVLV